MDKVMKERQDDTDKVIFIKLCWRKILSYKERVKRFINLRVAPIWRRVVNQKQFDDLLAYKDKHKGQRIFIIATGPSLREEDILKLKDEITIGVNGVIALYEKINWKPTYYCLGDPIVYAQYKEQILNANLTNAFFAWQLKKHESELNFKPVYYDSYLKGCLLKPSNKRMKKYMCFSDDPYKKGVYMGGRSVVTGVIQLAVYMGAKEIYLYGQDCNYHGEKKHFDSLVQNGKPVGSVDRAIDAQPAGSVDGFVEAMFAFFEKAKEYTERRGIKIYNATRGGKLEIFERVNLDEIL